MVIISYDAEVSIISSLVIAACLPWQHMAPLSGFMPQFFEYFNFTVTSQNGFWRSLIMSYTSGIPLIHTDIALLSIISPFRELWEGNFRIYTIDHQNLNQNGILFTFKKGAFLVTCSWFEMVLKIYYKEMFHTPPPTTRSNLGWMNNDKEHLWIMNIILLRSPEDDFIT